MNQHLATVGLEYRGGRSEIAPKLNNIEAYTEELAVRKVSFKPVVDIKYIASVGLGLKVSRSSRTRWRSSGVLKQMQVGAAEAQGEIAGDLKSGGTT